MDKLIAEEGLRRLAPEGGQLYAVMRHVSRSGLTRHVSIIGFSKEGMPYQLSGYISEYLGMTMTMPDGYPALEVSGCGFDAADHILRWLGGKLYGNDEALSYHWL